MAAGKLALSIAAGKVPRRVTSQLKDKIGSYEMAKAVIETGRAGAGAIKKNRKLPQPLRFPLFSFPQFFPFFLQAANTNISLHHFLIIFPSTLPVFVSTRRSLFTLIKFPWWPAQFSAESALACSYLH